jgi:hypothetical protein
MVPVTCSGGSGPQGAGPQFSGYELAEPLDHSKLRDYPLVNQGYVSGLAC